MMPLLASCLDPVNGGSGIFPHQLHRIRQTQEGGGRIDTRLLVRNDGRLSDQIADNLSCDAAIKPLVSQVRMPDPNTAFPGPPRSVMERNGWSKCASLLGHGKAPT